MYSGIQRVHQINNQNNKLFQPSNQKNEDEEYESNEFIDEIPAGKGAPFNNRQTFVSTLNYLTYLHRDITAKEHLTILLLLPLKEIKIHLLIPF